MLYTKMKHFLRWFWKYITLCHKWFKETKIRKKSLYCVLNFLCAKFFLLFGEAGNRIQLFSLVDSVIYNNSGKTHYIAQVNAKFLNNASIFIKIFEVNVQYY